jgi:hypothetical protein
MILDVASRTLTCFIGHYVPHSSVRRHAFILAMCVTTGYNEG